MIAQFIQDSIPVIEKIHFAPPKAHWYDIPQYAAIGSLERHLRSFLSMPQNWDGYGAVAPEDQTIANAKSILNLIPVAVLNRTTLDNIGVTPYGTIMFEWERGHFFLMIEIGRDEVAINGQTPNGKVDSRCNIASDGPPPYLSETRRLAEWYLPHRDTGIYLSR